MPKWDQITRKSDHTEDQTNKSNLNYMKSVDTHEENSFIDSWIVTSILRFQECGQRINWETGIDYHSKREVLINF